MSASTIAKSSSTSPYANSAFWERLWRMSGINFLAFFVIAYFLYGYQPPVGATAEALAAFYDGNRTRILIATVISGLAVLNFLWFAAALRTALADAGQGGWGAAATASSAVAGSLLLLLFTIGAALAYSIAGSGQGAFVSALNDFAWACVVLSSFPRGMFIMSSAFGFWRAGLISNSLFTAGVVVVVLTVLGGTTWLSDGFWSPYGAYSRLVSPIIGLVWVVVVSRVLSTRSPATRAGW